MNKFQPGDKIRFKTTEEEWKEYLEKEGYYDNELMKNNIISNGIENNASYPGPLTVINIKNDTIAFDLEGDCIWYHWEWFTYYEEENIPKEEDYTITEEGFKTNPKNWDKWLI